MTKQTPGQPNPSRADDIAQRLLMDDEEPAAPPVENEQPAAGAAEPDAAPAPAPSTPAELWRKRLEAAKLSEEEAVKILDAFVAPGFYQKEYKLLGGRVAVVFRTREVENAQRAAYALDALRNPNALTLNNTYALYNLAGSLVSYGVRGQAPRVFAFPKRGDDAAKADDLFNARLAFLRDPENVSGPVFEAMINRLYDFDKIVAAALSEGAAEGF
jgi:hypothetical protein